jgi:signal transduction histidine kinase
VRLLTRFTLLFISMTVTVAVSVGYFAVRQSDALGMKALSQQIEQLANAAHGNVSTSLADILRDTVSQHADVTLSLFSSSNLVTVLYQGSKPLNAPPTEIDVDETTNDLRELPSLPGFISLSVNVGAGDMLMISGSTSAVDKARRALEQEVILIALAITLTSLAIGQLVMRRDLRSIGQLANYALDYVNGVPSSVFPEGGSSKDIRELESALLVLVRTLTKELETAATKEKVMQEFLGDASHELRTPLTVITGYTELLGRTGVNDEQRIRALERMREQEARMGALIGDLLFLAEVKELPTTTDGRFNASAVATKMARDFAAAQPRPVETAITTGLNIDGRQDYFERIFVNALTNVRRYTSETDPVKISLSLEGQEVKLRIEDGGPGLPTYGETPQRFQRFEQSRSRDLGGSGLGMSIMLSIAESLGGTMSTEKSTLGGLALCFNFPVS